MRLEWTPVTVSPVGGRGRSRSGQRAMAIAIGMWESGQWDGTKWRYGARATVADATVRVGTAELGMCGTILAHSDALLLDAMGLRRDGRWARESLTQDSVLPRGAAEAMRQAGFIFRWAYSTDNVRLSHPSAPRPTGKLLPVALSPWRSPIG